MPQKTEYGADLPDFLTKGAAYVKAFVVILSKVQNRIAYEIDFQKFGGANTPPKNWGDVVEVKLFVPVAYAVAPGTAITPEERKRARRVILRQLERQAQLMSNAMIATMPGEAELAEALVESDPVGSVHNPIRLDPDNPAAGM